MCAWVQWVWVRWVLVGAVGFGDFGGCFECGRKNRLWVLYLRVWMLRQVEEQLTSHFLHGLLQWAGSVTCLAVC